MALVQASGRVKDPSRKKKSGPLDLKKEVQTKIRVLRIDSYVAVVGSQGSGRKTLAYRLCHMEGNDILQEVPVNYRYEGFYMTNLPEGREINSNSRVTLTVHYYIIEPPAAGPVLNPPRYLEVWDNFCCMLLCFDVRNQRSFLEARMKLDALRERNLVIPSCMLTGNKSDRRYILPPQPENPDDPEYLNQREIPLETAIMEADHLHLVGYIECSARTKYRVNRVLLFVKLCALGNWFFY